MSESRPRYVALGENIGIVYLQMRDESFRTASAMWMSTNQNSHVMHQDDAYYWFQVACKGGAVYG